MLMLFFIVSRVETAIYILFTGCIMQLYHREKKDLQKTGVESYRLHLTLTTTYATSLLCGQCIKIKSDLRDRVYVSQALKIPQEISLCVNLISL